MATFFSDTRLTDKPLNQCGPDHVCSIIPDYLLEDIADSDGFSDQVRACARKTLRYTQNIRNTRSSFIPNHSAHVGHPIGPSYILQDIIDSDQTEEEDELRAQKTLEQSEAIPVARSAPRGHSHRMIYDVEGTNRFPGNRIRYEGQVAIQDLSANQVYDFFKDIFDFYWHAYKRDSIDDHGMSLIGSIHVDDLVPPPGFNNALWDGSQMIFGDGDGIIFTSFTKCLDVIAHELTHGVTQYTANLPYRQQSGALNEHISDAFSAMAKQWNLNQEAQDADWLIGEGIFVPGFTGRALRDMKAPGTAYDDPRLRAKDRQVGHMDLYVVLPDDDIPRNDHGGVHINSGILNRAFYLVATALGGHSWDRAGRIWYTTLLDPRLRRFVNDLSNWNNCFSFFAGLTCTHAAEYGEDVQAIVRQAWEGVGVGARPGDVLHEGGMPMTQVRNALSYLEDGQHTVKINVDWQLQEFVRYGLDNPRDLETVLTITGEPEEAYACSCEDYVKFAWGKNTSIPEFFRAFVASEYISSAKEFSFRSSQFNVSAVVEVTASPNGSEKSTFQVEAERDCLVEVCECLSWLAAVCRPPEPSSIHASSATFKKVDVNYFTIRMEPLRPLPPSGSLASIGCCWLNMFNGGYVLARGFPVPRRKSSRGIELPLDMMVEQAMTYHTISHRGSIILKGSNTALVPISVDGIGTLDQAEEVQWHLIGKKPKLVHVDLNVTEGYYLTDAEFSTGDPDLCWEAIDQRGLKTLAVNSLQGFSGKRQFVGYFPRAQNLLGTKESGYEKVERSDAKLVKGTVIKFDQAINVTVGTNFGTAGIVSLAFSERIRRTKYDNTPKQIPAFIGDQLRNRENKAHILYDVEKKTAWMIPEACIILYLMHRWASLQNPPSTTDDLQEAPHDPSSPQQSGRSQPSNSRQQAPLETYGGPVLGYMPFVGASCNSGKEATNAIWRKISVQLPEYVRSPEKPEKPVRVWDIVARMYLIIDALVEHQKRKKPGFFRRQRDRPYLWGYEFADVAGSDKAPAKGVRIDKARSGGWYALTKPHSEIAILFGNKFGDPIRYESGQAICHLWKSVPVGYDFLSADSEALKYLEILKQKGLFDLVLSDENSGTYKRHESQPCGNEDWPCCNMALQLMSRSRRVTIDVKKGEAVVIGKAGPRLIKPAGKASQKPGRRRLEDPVETQSIKRRLSEINEPPNGTPSGQASDERVEDDTATEPEQFNSSDDAEYLSCDEYSSVPFEDDSEAREKRSIRNGVLQVRPTT
ncbi:hypothetical protein LTR84_012431 [Exophiala bonariae]|uniref:Uncharacterized protein n=1 Tax=Exophiala bonariae TaxID=1690606 RepID=A0AAV9MR56_9EURO|nr:hypothetical protein LTR84_012431 [Exophiala bonariae]